MVANDDFAHNVCASFSACVADVPALMRQVHCNMQAMLRARGYVLTFTTTDADIAERMHAERAIMTGTHPTRGDVCVFYHATDKLGVGALRTLLQNTVAPRIIIVSTVGPTNFTRREGDPRGVQHFTYKELSVDRAKHSLVPKHILVNAEDHPDRHKYPKLLTSDPMSQYYDFLIGSVVRIERVAGNSEVYNAYRIVCA
tara:strand:+ start:568 stop:1164 length:597 start_codon:yes stop_codon:yes gene_type:complete